MNIHYMRRYSPFQLVFELSETRAFPLLSGSLKALPLVMSELIDRPPDTVDLSYAPFEL